MKSIIWDFNGTVYNPETKQLYSGAKELLKKSSKKYQQVMVTAALINPVKRKELIRKMGIWNYFDQIDISFKTPKLFLNLCDKLNCSSKDVYVIGDGYFKEIVTGNKLGMKTIWIDRKGIGKLKERLLRIKYWKKVKYLSELETILL